VNTIGVNPSAGLVALPVEPIDPSQKIATGCAAKNDSSFVATGRGGVPKNPMQVLEIDRIWSDLRTISKTKPEPRIAAAAMPIEAMTLATNAQGQIELIGVGAIAANPVGVTCSRP
jgi:large exoprotein involved in heme utilization and adhesion